MRGKKEIILGGSANAAASAKSGGFLGIETEFVDPFRLGRPSSYVTLHLITVQAMPRYICSCHSIVRKDVKILSVRRSTSGSRRFIPERLILDVPCRGPGIKLCFIS